MIVIAIIAILAVVGMSVFGNIQKTARNARRKADLKAMSNAMEINYNNTVGSYKPLAVGMFASGAIPKDPKGTSYGGATAATASNAGGYLPANGYTFSSTLEGMTVTFKNQRN